MHVLHASEQDKSACETIPTIQEINGNGFDPNCIISQKLIQSYDVILELAEEDSTATTDTTAICVASNLFFVLDKYKPEVCIISITFWIKIVFGQAGNAKKTGIQILSISRSTRTCLIEKLYDGEIAVSQVTVLTDECLDGRSAISSISAVQVDCKP